MNYHSAVVLLSGGIDSTVTLAYALTQAEHVHALTLDYGQVHGREVIHARQVVAEYLGRDSRAGRAPRVTHWQHQFDAFDWNKSALIWNGGAEIPQSEHVREVRERATPAPTYVPARAAIFLSLALSLAETMGSEIIYYGATGSQKHPDCTRPFLDAMRLVAQWGIHPNVAGQVIDILAPYRNLTKEQVIRVGKGLMAPLELTWSCYKSGKTPCHKCDSCLIREQGFHALAMDDPLVHAR